MRKAFQEKDLIPCLLTWLDFKATIIKTVETQNRFARHQEVFTNIEFEIKYHFFVLKLDTLLVQYLLTFKGAELIQIASNRCLQKLFCLSNVWLALQPSERLVRLCGDR